MRLVPTLDMRLMTSSFRPRFMPTNHVIAGWCYILSGLLDAFDGHAARALDQSSKFGAMLDMLTDRCCTMALLATLCTFYPGWAFCFQLSMVIDVSCHWIHLHASLMRVSEGTLKILFKGCCLQMLNCIESISFIG